MVCRNKGRADAAKDEIVERSKNQLLLLFSSFLLPEHSRACGRYVQCEAGVAVRPELLTKQQCPCTGGCLSLSLSLFSLSHTHTQTHILVFIVICHAHQINNAGCMVNQRELTEEGLEKNFATNTLGTYILTTALIPALKKVEDPRVVTVSSGGMLTQKLNVDDLQFEKGTFDGTMAYAQNKRQQVILTERWALQHKEIHFSSMHPGWADTPAVQSSMPSFHAKMQSKLRTEAMGADTVVWLAVSPAAVKQPSGLFFQDRKAVATHLPLASSRSTPQEEEKLLTALEEFALKFKP
ncbi:hypothetical protein INR49_010163 [Caranx melampygus]|nr:hypothetical protein INR49_010163 [Caranx melampygus]